MACTVHMPAGLAVPGKLVRLSRAVRLEIPGVFADLGTVLLAAFCLAGAAIVLSVFDGDLQGSDEVVGAVLGTLSLLGVLAGLELTDRIKGKRYCSKESSSD